MTARQALRSLQAAVGSAALASGLALAVDLYEPDDSAIAGLGLLVHGQTQARDLEGTSNVDYMHIDAVPGHSYEVRMLVPRSTAYHELSRRSAAAANLQTALGIAFNAIRNGNNDLSSWNPHTSAQMNWIEPQEGDPGRTRFIRVADTGSTPRTAAGSAYTVEMRETTMYCARYNNTGGQTTVLILQRAYAEETFENANGCNWTARFYDQASVYTGGALNGAIGGSNSNSGTGLYTNGMQVISTTSVPGVANTKGSIQVSHTCGYGKVQAKTVALEPATGFSFDTPCAPRPH
jgi:hypothetical protein